MAENAPPEAPAGRTIYKFDICEIVLSEDGLVLEQCLTHDTEEWFVMAALGANVTCLRNTASWVFLVSKGRTSLFHPSSAPLIPRNMQDMRRAASNLFKRSWLSSYVHQPEEVLLKLREIASEMSQQGHLPQDWEWRQGVGSVTVPLLTARFLLRSGLSSKEAKAFWQVLCDKLRTQYAALPATIALISELHARGCTPQELSTLIAVSEVYREQPSQTSYGRSKEPTIQETAAIILQIWGADGKGWQDRAALLRDFLKTWNGRRDEITSL